MMMTTVQDDGMAGPLTPLIRDCWYVAAWSSEITRTMLARRILGDQVVLYRTEAGAAVALHDRCPHRSLPLSQGCLEGDAVRCGYHGLLFDAAGQCVEAPPVDRPPRAMRVRSYDVVERGKLAWIWTGEGPGDPAAIPDLWWLDDPEWVYGSGMLTIQSNYVALHENLLDLTHFTFLHPGNIGTPEYASAPYKVSRVGDIVRVERFVADCGVPGIYQATGLGERRISRLAVSEFVGPALHTARAELTPLAAEPGERASYTVRVTHFVTPRDLGSTQYFFAIARNFAQDDQASTEAMRAGAIFAFKQDADALEAIAAIQRDQPDFVEKSMRSDEAGVTMRRLLRSRSEAGSKR